MKPLHIIFLLTFVLEGILSHDQIILLRRNVFLNRHKRYLNFPPSSNFVITTSITKPLIRPQPLGYNSILEMDVPFPLPSDLWTMKNKMKDVKEKNKFWKVHYRYKRESFQRIEDALEGAGLNSTSCVQRIYCDANEYLDNKTQTKSLLKELLTAIFRSVNNKFKFSDCNGDMFESCSLPLFEYIMRSLNTAYA